MAGYSKNHSFYSFDAQDLVNVGPETVHRVVKFPAAETEICMACLAMHDMLACIRGDGTCPLYFLLLHDSLLPPAGCCIPRIVVSRTCCTAPSLLQPHGISNPSRISPSS